MADRASGAASSRHSRALPTGVPPHRAPLVAWMFIAIALVTGLAWWDDQREANATLHDLEDEQAILAAGLAGSLRAHLTALERDAVLVSEHGPAFLGARFSPVAIRPAHAACTPLLDPSRLLISVPVSDRRVVDFGVDPRQLVDGQRKLKEPGQLLVLIEQPGDPSFHTVGGGVADSPSIRDALDRGLPALRLTRDESAQVGLPPRTSMAGIARVETQDMGRWGIASVASAARERDREIRALWRLVLGVLVASGLVLAFGGAALRKQRKELELQHELAMAEVRRQRDEDLLRAARAATMGTFAMGIAHEVSTPLAVIVGRAEQLLARVKNDDRSERSALTILKQTERIEHTVRRFLDMARGGPPRLERAEPAGVLRAATGAVEHRFVQAGVSFVTDIAPALPYVQCDRDLLEHAVVNLLLNACEACLPGGHVEVTASSDNGRIVVDVTDDGAGISAEDAARATEPFFTTKPAGVGTGLGLAIAAEIVKSHRGEISVAPNPGRGTRARIAIPAASDPLPEGRQRGSRA